MRGNLGHRIDTLVHQVNNRLSDGLKTNLSAYAIQIYRKLRLSIHQTYNLFGESKRIDRSIIKPILNPLIQAEPISMHRSVADSGG